MPLAAGDKLGPYEILGLIGAGGMGEVYKARDTRLDRIVAVKVSQERFSERFQREARAVAALNHPYICTLHDVGPDYLVMEYVDGQTLKGPLPREQALKYARQICEALDAAHSKDVTHRDLKPDNILVTKQGIKLLDFGLARLATGSGDQTVTMAVMGTPAYMSPEQWEGKPGDARSDIYAFGCVLYELLTGRRAAQDRTQVEPPQLESLLRTCLEKDPENRWQSVRDVKAALELVTVGKAILSPVKPPWRERGAWIAAAGVLLSVALFFALRPSPPPSSGDLVSFALYPPEKAAFLSPLIFTVGVPQFAISPDGRTIVFAAAATEGARSVLWRRPIGEAAAQPLVGTEDAQDPFWAPDSRWVGFFAEGKLKKTPAAGGAVQVVVPTATDPRGGTWGPDETILFSNGTQALQRVSSAGGLMTTASVLAPQEGSHRYPQFLPDGRHFLYLVPGGGQSGVYAGSLDDKTKKLVVRTNASAVYAPPGYLLYVDGDTLLGLAFDAERLKVSGQPFLIAEHVGRTSTYFSAVSASVTGAIAYAGTLVQKGRLTWFDRGGISQGSAGLDGYYTDFRLSPNGKLLAASVLDPKTGIVDVWMKDLARGSNTKVTNGEGVANASPIWSPDGTQFVYRTNRTGAGNEFYERSANGGENEQLMLEVGTARGSQIQSGALTPTDWSPNGHHILFSVSGTAYGYDLWLLPLTSDRKPEKFLALPSDEMHGNFSPDGNLVAYTSNKSGKFEVYVATFPRPDHEWTVSVGGGYEPRWKPDSGEIYYLSEDRHLMAVTVSPGPIFGNPKPLFQTQVPAGVTPNRTHHVPSHDGQRFLINTQTGDPSPNPITVVLNWVAGLKK